ncbi:MAG: hypothetical protein WC273_11325 [Dehalococcoidia bacterium]
MLIASPTAYFVLSVVMVADADGGAALAEPPLPLDPPLPLAVTLNVACALSVRSDAVTVYWPVLDVPVKVALKLPDELVEMNDIPADVPSGRRMEMFIRVLRANPLPLIFTLSPTAYVDLSVVTDAPLAAQALRGARTAIASTATAITAANTRKTVLRLILRVM